MRTLALNSTAVQSEIDALFEALAANPTLWMPLPWPFHDPLAGMDFAGLLKDVKPEPRHRTRSFNQRDIARALRAAKAAGVEARDRLLAALGTSAPAPKPPTYAPSGAHIVYRRVSLGAQRRLGQTRRLT